jgi:uncharacterized protein (TIGR02594 family)
MRAFLATGALVLSVAIFTAPAAFARAPSIQAPHHHARALHRDPHRVHAHRHHAHRPHAHGHRARPHRPAVTANAAAEQPVERPFFAPQAIASALIGAMARDLGHNPTGWARAWCGHYLGMIARQLGFAPPRDDALAANWKSFGRAVAGPAPGVVVVWPHHVGVVRAVLGDGRILVRSGNHGHRVADGVYSTRGVIAWRAPA